MKRTILSFVFSLCAVIVSAQSTNPLNYSGKLFITSIDVLSTPRYVSFEEHAILSTDVSIPIIEVTKVNFDFENDIINLDNTVHNIKVTSVKKYSSDDNGWIIVLYIDFIGENDKYELVWREFGRPYLQEISQTDDGIKIIRMNLSTKPLSASYDGALL